jgi:hypothetical protein
MRWVRASHTTPRASALAIWRVFALLEILSFARVADVHPNSGQWRSYWLLQPSAAKIVHQTDLV